MPELSTILADNTYYAGNNSKFPYFLIQLTDKEELPYKGALVSDAIVEYIQNNEVTHILAQTHGWNTERTSSTCLPAPDFSSMP